MTATHTPSSQAATPAYPAAKHIPFDRISVVDFALFQSDSLNDRLMVANQIGKALNDTGFFYLSNHGIPQHLIDRVFTQSRWFFDQPMQEKMTVSADLTTNRRGFFPIGGENVDPLHTKDVKEGFDIGFEGPDPAEASSDTEMRGGNLWPAGQGDFREALETYYGALTDLGRQLCRAFALTLDLPEDMFDKNVEHSDSRLRLLSYPPQDAPTEAEMGIGAHTDCGCLTILAQDTNGGLQAQNSAGEWISVDPIPGTFVCNVGDLMHQWSHRHFASTVHRVINTQDQRRHSVAFFFNPSFDVMVERWESLMGAEATGTEPQTAGEYFSCCFSEIRGPAKTESSACCGDNKPN